MTKFHHANTDFTFNNARWVAERRCDVFDFITNELLEQKEQPIKCDVDLSPNLAYLIECNNAEEFAARILDVPVNFKVNWSLTSNSLRLTIS